MPDELHSDEHREATATQYATLAQVTELKEQVRVLSLDFKGMKVTVEGDVKGATRVPGLVDIVGDAVKSMTAIKWILSGIGLTVLIDASLQVLRDFGLLHVAAH